MMWQKVGCQIFKHFFFHDILYIIYGEICKNEKNPMILFLLCEAHEKVTSEKRYSFGILAL